MAVSSAAGLRSGSLFLIRIYFVVAEIVVIDVIEDNPVADRLDGSKIMSYLAVR